MVFLSAGLYGNPIASITVSANATTAKNMLGNPNIQTPSQALDIMLQTGKIDQATYNLFKGMV